MAQADGVVANGTGAAVRSDLNGQLAALFTNHSGSTSPSTTYAHQFWADTNENVLKIRNAANNAWITLRELDGTMLIEDGTAAAPGLAFADDTNTGIYSPAADQIGITTGGTQRVLLKDSVTVFNDGGNDTNFRVESDNQSNMFFVDAGLDRIGIGTGTPAAKLHVVTSGEDQIRIADGTRAAALGSTGSINFVGAITSGQGFAFYSANEERMRLVSNGRFLINTSTARSNFFNSTVSPQVQLEGTGDFDRQMSITSSATADARGAILILAHQKSGTAGGNTVVASGTTCGRLSFQGSDGSEFVEAAKIESAVDATPGANDMPGRLTFHTTADGSAGPTERLRIDKLGRVGIATTSPGSYYAQQLVVDTGSAAQSGITIVSDSSNQGMLAFADGTSGADRYRGFLDYNHSDNSLAFGSNGSERMRIDSSGRFLHGITSPSSSTLKFEVAANVGPDPAFRFNQTATSGISYDMFFTKTGYAPDDSSSRFLSCTDTSATRMLIRADGDVLNHDNSYGSLSDVSLKQQIVDASSQWDDIKGVRVRKFKMNSDVEAYGDEAGFRIGVIAQELEQTSPGLVKNNQELDGTILKSVSYSVLYMKAIKALQEAQTRIETLETQHADLLARVAALEAG